MGKKKRIFSFDVIRVIAMMLIVIAHYVTEMVLNGFFSPEYMSLITVNGLAFGHIGVTLFLVLSGASLMFTYTSRKFELKDYFLKRIRAIFPPFLLAWAVVTLAKLAVFPESFKGIPVRNLVFSLIGMDGYLKSVLPTFYVVGEWYIGMQILLYLCFPFLYFGIRRKPVLTAFILLLIEIPLLIFYPFQKILSYQNVFLRIFDMYAGMILVCYGKKIKGLKAAAIGLVLLIPSYLFTFSYKEFIVIRCQLSGIGWFLLIQGFIDWIENKKKEPLSFGVISFLSGISYEVFLTHHVIFLFLAAYIYPKIALFQKAGWVLLAFLPAFLFAIISAIVLKWIIDRLLELPGNGKKPGQAVRR